MKKKLTLFALLFCVMLICLVPKPVDAYTASYTKSQYQTKYNQFINDARWKHGISWGQHKPLLSTYKSAGCCAYTADWAKYMANFDSPRYGEAFYDRNQIRAGDIVHWFNSEYDQHWYVVLERNGNSLYTAEAGFVPDPKNRPGYQIANISNRYTVSGTKFTVGYHIVNIKPDTKPAPPSSASVAKADIGKGDGVNVSWSASSGATAYDVKLVCTTNSAYTTSVKSVSGTSTSYVINNPGTYKVSVAAKNAAGTSAYTTSSNSITVHNNVNVTFKDYDGRTLKTQSVKWGGNASAPAAPDREGYTFQNWDKSLTGIKTDTTITAEYKINSYSVSFVDYQGNTIGQVQKVDYGSSAVAPASVPADSGYVFTGWDSEAYKNVKKALTIKAVYQWENTDLPSIITVKSATRNSDGTGYDVKVNMKNFPDNFTKAKLVVGIMTDDNKLVASETDSVSVSSSGQVDKDVFVMYSGIAKKAYVTLIGVVDDDTTGTPKSKSVEATLDNGEAWSDWSGNQPPTGSNIISETRKEYRTKTKKVIRATSKPATPSGYTYSTSAKTGTYTAWGSWTGYWPDKHTASATKEVRTTTMYRYFAWVCPSCGQRDDGSGACSKCGKSGLYWEETWGTCSGYSYTSNWNFGSKLAGRIYWNNKYWYFELNGVNNGWTGTGQPTTTGYSYRTRTEYIDYTYWTTDWSAWSGTAATSDSSTQVETRTAYRFKTNASTVDCFNYKRYKYTNLTTGNIVYDYSSSYADSKDYPGEWEYNTSYKELNSVRTVDGNIVLYNALDDPWYAANVNNEGAQTTYQSTASLEDQTGETRTVEGTVPNAAGKQATLLVYKGKNSDPTASQIEYISQATLDDSGNYRFVFKTKEEPSVKTGDFIITLGLEGSTNYMEIGKIEAPKPTYSVNFIDGEGNEIGETVYVKEGSDADAPEAPEKEGYEFVGWDTGLRNIHENLVVTAEYKKKDCTVVFVNWNNQDVAIREMKYGDELTDVLIPAKEGGRFKYWVDEEGNQVSTVKGDMIVTASFNDAEYTVVFLDWDGNILKQYNGVKYGDSVAEPSISAPNNQYKKFDHWDADGLVDCVEKNMEIKPVAKFKETTATPEISLQEGEYVGDQIVTLSCNTNDADIYYLVDDGTEEYNAAGQVYDELVPYTTPLTIETSSTVYAVAKSSNKEDSDPLITSYTIKEPAKVSEIRFAKSALNMQVGGRATLSVEILPADAFQKAVTWSSSDEDVVMINQKGVAVAMSEGKATITATAKDGSGVKGTCEITVSDAVEHNIVKTEAKMATFTADGKTAGEECSICGEVFKESKIVPKVSNVKLSVSSYKYDGKTKSPVLTVKDSKGNVLNENTDYILEVPTGRKNVGKYDYYVFLVGNYEGGKFISFKINPAGTTQYAPARASKAFTAKWKKSSAANATGYQIRYSLKSSMASSKTVTVKGYKYASKKISKLKAKKTYYIQVRCYKTVNGVNYYSGWSAKKSVKTK